MTNKPLSCLGCRCYEKDVLVTGSGCYPARVLFLAATPPPWGGLFTDKAGKIITTIIDELAQEERALRGGITAMSDMARGRHYMYAVQCPSGKTEKKILDQCASSVTHSQIIACDPEVIVPLGAGPLRSLSVAGNVKDLRGHCTTANIAGKTFKVVPTLSPVTLIDGQSGLYNIIKSDIATAARVAAQSSITLVSLDALRDTYDIPGSLGELEKLAERYSTYAPEGREVSQTMMAIDTETNTKYPWAPGAKIIMVSAAIESRVSSAMFLEHRSAPYDWREALPYILKITMSGHPKCWWNYKFDYSMFRFALMPKLRSLCAGSSSYKELVEKVVGVPLEEVYRWHGIRNTRWDGLMGEHMVDEDKKGFNGLKSVIKEYAPEYAGYEETLKESFRKAAEIRGESAEKEFLGVDCTVHPEGVECKEDWPFDVPSGTTFSELKPLAEAEKRKIRSEIRKAKKQGDSVERLEAQLAGVVEWVTEHKVIYKSLERAASTYKKVLMQALESSSYSSLTFEDIDPDTLALYAAIDADATLLICRDQRKRAFREDRPAEGKRALIELMDRHYLPLTELLAEMQHSGVAAEQSYLADLRELLSTEAENLRVKITHQLQSDLGYSEEEVILNNPKFMGDVFIAGYGLPKLATTAKGQASMNEKVIVEYAEMGNPIAQDFLNWRKLCKAQSTYVERLKRLSQRDGRIHGTIHLNGAATGRTSSAEPNLQNTPHFLGKVNIKKIFVPTPIHNLGWWVSDENRALAGKHGWVKEDRLIWGDVDFSGAEVRVLTRYAPDKDLIQALLEGVDIHSWMTAEIHQIPYEEINEGRKTDPALDELRRKTKQVVFGTIYGITSHGLQQRMGFTEEEAQETIDKLLGRFPAIKEYTERTKAEIARNQKISTPYGRFRRFPMANVGRWIKSRNERQGVNFLIQSYCSDIVMSCLNNMAERIQEIRGRMLLTVHDSICFEMPESEYPNLQSFLDSTLTEHIKEEFPDLPVPMPFDIKVGWSYGETVSPQKWAEARRK